MRTHPTLPSPSPADEPIRPAQVIKASDPSAATSVRLLGARNVPARRDAAPTDPRDVWRGDAPAARRLALPALGAADGLTGRPGEDGPPTNDELRHAEEPEAGLAADENSQQWSREVARLRELVADVVGQLIEERRRLLLSARDQVVELALAIARRIVRREVHSDREVVVRVLSEALARLERASRVRVRLNPEDMRSARAGTARARQPLTNVSGLELVADPEVPQGGCIVETPSGSIDATIETQFAEMEKVMAHASGAGAYADEPR